MTVADIERLLDLPPTDRLRLVEVLWDSLQGQPGAVDALTDDERRTIEARLAKYRADPSRVLEWSEIKSRLADR